MRKTIAEAYPDTTRDDILAENPELQRRVEAKRLEKENDGRLVSRFRQQQSVLADKDQQLFSFLQLLDGLKEINFPAVLMANTRNSQNGLLVISQVAGNFAGAWIVKSCEPQLRQMATQELSDLKRDFEKLVDDNRAALRRMELI